MKPPGPVREYFANIGRAVSTIFEGLAVTASWMFRRPMTIQYPDRIEKPVQAMLPDCYRGVLEADMQRCSGCLLCGKACPIDCITVKVEKNAETGVREIVQFDIDIGKCMYCGLCVEACKFDSLRHTTEFEATASTPEGLVLHFVKKPAPVSKHKAGQGPARAPQGSIVRKLIPPCLGRRPVVMPGEGPRQAEPSASATTTTTTEEEGEG